MRDTEVHSATVRWLHSITNVKVIKAFPGKDDPDTPYIVCNFISTREVRENAQDELYEEASGEVTAIPVIETEWHFSLHAIGPGPTDILRPVRAAAQLAQKNEPLMPALIIFECSAIRHVPEFKNAHWEPRAQMDFFVRGAVRDGFVIDTIEEFSVGITQTNREGHT